MLHKLPQQNCAHKKTMIVDNDNDNDNDSNKHNN